MKPILYLIYNFLKLLTKLFLRVYYPNMARIGLHHLRYRGGSILVSNHPNTLIDPLNAASRVPKIVHFLANASLFQSPFGNWFFNTFFCIPVERPQDTKGRQINNKDSFLRSQAFLRSGGCLYIAPEGGSELGRQVRPFKTGTARIALSAEAAFDFKLGLRILPVGLTYDDAGRFRSRATIHGGEPILVQDYEAAYRKSSVQAARKLTQDLEDRVRSLCIDTEDAAEDRCVQRVEELLRNARPVGAAAHFHRTKQFIEQRRAWAADDPQAEGGFQARLGAYFEGLERLGSSDRAMQQAPRLWQWLRLLLLAPGFAYGAINNALPAYLPRLAAQRLKIDPGYTATVKILVGLLAFPICYALQTVFVAQFASTPIAMAYLLSLPLSGWLALKWVEWGRYAQAWLRLRSHPGLAALRQEREWLLSQALSLVH